MRPLLLTVLVFAFGLIAMAQPVNPGFESGNPGQPPTGWGAWPVSTGLQYRAWIVSTGCVEGRQCAVSTGPGATGSNIFSGVSQTVNAAAYGGKTVRFRAAVKAGSAYGRLWVRVDSSSGAVLFNINSGDIRGTEWAYYSVDVPVAVNGARIQVGFLVFGTGNIWVDDTSLVALQPSQVDAPRALSDTGLANMTAFAKLLGYVRHFHPSSQVAMADWNEIAVEGARAIEAAGSAEDLAAQLQSIFAEVAPTVRVFVKANRPELPAELRPASLSDLKVARWNHYGAGLGPGSNIYQSALQFEPAASGGLPDGYEDPLVPWEADLGRGVAAMVPLTVYADADGTLPRRAAPRPSTIGWSAQDRATRLGGVVLAWNVIQHFYPYHDVMDTDWPAELTKALRSAATDTGERDYLRTLSRLVAAQKDGHGYANGPGGSTTMVPLVWDWVEDQLIVTRVKPSQAHGAVPGDRVLKIDGRVVDEVIAEQKELISGATPQWILWRTLSQIARCDESGRMRLEVEPYDQPGTSLAAVYTCGTDTSWSELRPDVVVEIEPGIWYVDINGLTADLWQTWLPRIQGAKGVVFDLRGYPQTTAYFPNLGSTPMSSSQWHVPTPLKPDRAGMAFYQANWWIQPADPLLAARRVFLTDGRAVSYAETEMAIVENYKLAEIVGGTTAGTNGNINYNYLPGGFNVSFTGMKVLKHDGSQYHGVGVRPTIPAGRTRAGIVAGRDEVLERGLEVVRGPKTGPAPAIGGEAIVNAASGKAGPVAPGEMVTIYGTGLGPDALVQTAADGCGFLGRYAGGTRVFFDEVQAPVVHALKTQVTAIVPYGVSGTTKVRVEYELRSSNEVTLAVAASTPGVFRVVVNQDGSINSDAKPAARGEAVSLFATGEGQTSPAILDGRMPAAGKWPAAAASLAVTVGGASAEVVFQGLISPGVLQVNLKVPQGATTGNAVALVLSVGGAASQAVTLAVK